MERPEYYGILPAKVRYDERLKPIEKILFSELIVLVHKKGYCYANNSYFAKLYGVHKNTVSVWINNLAKYGHIVIKYIMKDKQVEEKREKTSEELEEIRRKLLKDLFGDKVVIELQKRKTEEELVEEEKQEIEE